MNEAVRDALLLIQLEVAERDVNAWREAVEFHRAHQFRRGYVLFRSSRGAFVPCQIVPHWCEIGTLREIISPAQIPNPWISMIMLFVNSFALFA